MTKKIKEIRQWKQEDIRYLFVDGLTFIATEDFSEMVKEITTKISEAKVTTPSATA